MGLDYGTLRAQRGAGMRHVDDGCRACDVGLRGQVAALKTSLRERVGELTACADGMHGELEALAAERDAADRQHEVALSKALSECHENVVWRDSLMREREGLLMLVQKGRDDAQAMQDELGRLRSPCWSCGEAPLAVSSPVPAPPREPSPPRRALSPRPIPGHLRPSAASSSAHGIKGQGESAAASSGGGASPEHADCFCAPFMCSPKCLMSWLVQRCFLSSPSSRS